MKKFNNVPLFQYGLNANGLCIPEETVRKCMDTFKNKPIMVYKSEDPYNKENYPIGFISEVTDIKEPFVYGSTEVFNEEEICEFKNYGIQVEESHNEGNIVVVDKFKLMDVSFKLKD